MSSGVYKSLNCGIGSKDQKENVFKNLRIISNKIGCKYKSLITLKQRHSDKFYLINKVPKIKLKLMELSPQRKI